ncbi:MAG: lipocalin-like domain-containing protein [Chloroflexota bacterium]|nr:lipocalin-like domain-containing protein [Chloroflexota bacterium]
MSQSVVGTWRLKRWEARDADGNVAYPLGPDAVGYLVYTPDGHVSVAMMRADRPPFAGDDLLGGTPEELAAAAAGYVAYCGRYEVRGDGAVVHRVELSLFPNWVGSEQVRFAAVAGDELTITTRPLRIGGETVNQLVWERVECAPDEFADTS